jgi:MFS family permease
MNKWYTLLVVGTASFLTIMDFGLFGVALPQLALDFNLDPNVMLWLTIIVFLGQSGPTLIMGWISDNLGRGRIFFIGSIITTLSLLLCAISNNFVQLLLARSVGAIGYSFIMANDNSLISSAFSKKEIGVAQGINNAFLGIGIGTGALLGGWLIDTINTTDIAWLNWRSFFWIRIIPWLILVGLSSKLFEKKITVRNLIWNEGGFKRKFSPKISTTFGNQNIPKISQVDYFGAFIIFLAVTTVLLSIQSFTFLDITLLGISAISSIFLVSILLFVLFAYIESRVKYPVVNVELFKIKNFTSGLIGMATVQIVHGGWVVLIPMLFVSLGWSATLYGLLMFPFHTIRIILSPISGYISAHHGVNIPSFLGLLAMIVGLLLAMLYTPTTSSIFVLLTMLLAGSGMSIFLPANNTAIMSDIPKQYLSSASGFLAASRGIGISIGTAIAVAIASNYGSTLESFDRAIVVLSCISAVGLLAIYWRSTLWFRK